MKQNAKKEPCLPPFCWYLVAARTARTAMESVEAFHLEGDKASVQHVGQTLAMLHTTAFLEGQEVDGLVRAVAVVPDGHTVAE